MQFKALFCQLMFAKCATYLYFYSIAFFFLSYCSAMVMKKTSPLLFRAVSTESCTTPMTNPIATACIATSLPIPKNEHAQGSELNDPLLLE